MRTTLQNELVLELREVSSISEASIEELLKGVSPSAIEILLEVFGMIREYMGDQNYADGFKEGSNEKEIEMDDKIQKESDIAFKEGQDDGYCKGYKCGYEEGYEDAIEKNPRLRATI